MSVSELSAVERIARVLAGQRYSANADGYDPSAADAVDGAWQDHVGDAMAVLRTLREPDTVMADAGDPEVWKRMVEAAIRDAEGDPQ